MSRTKMRRLTILTLTTSLALPALAQEPIAVSGELQVNTYTTNDQQAPAVAIDPSGNFVVVWQSDVLDGPYADSEIQAQRFNSSGQKLGDEFQVNTMTLYPHLNPAVAMDGNDDANGQFVVVWQSYDTSDFGIFTQRFDAAGQKLGSERGVNTGQALRQSHPVLASVVASDATADDFVVVWQSENGDSAPAFGDSIQAQRLDSAGQMLGVEFRVNTYTPDHQRYPAVAADASGNFIVVWQSDGQDGSGQSIHAQRFNSAGQTLGGEFQVNAYTTGGQSNPAVATEATGSFVVVWQSDGQDGSGRSVQAQRFDSAGQMLGGEFQVNTYTTGHQRYPAVATEPSSNFVVVWQSDGQDGSGESVQAQRFDSLGGKLGDEFQVNTYTTNSQSAPALAIDDSDHLVVVWQTSGGQDGDAASVHAQRYLLATAAVGDLVWLDEDLDGIQDAGEPGIEGVRVNLYDETSNLLAFTETNASGGFLFEHLSAGDVFLEFELPLAYAFTHQGRGDDDADSDADPTFGQTIDFYVSAVADLDWDAGMANGVGNFVWLDDDLDGLQDGGELGVPGVAVELFTAQGASVATTTTDTHGSYAFADLRPGDYYLQFTAPPGLCFTAQDAGDDAYDSDVDPELGTTFVFAFTHGVIDRDWDAGLVPEPDSAARVGDRVWLDLDGDGIQDGGEPGVPAVEVRIYREPDPPFRGAIEIATTTTDADGYYSFTVEPGLYYLEIGCHALTVQHQGDDNLDSDFDPGSRTTTAFTLAEGAADRSRDGGLTDADGDDVATCVDNCPADANADQLDGDGDGAGDVCDLCTGDDAFGDADTDGVCADLDCDDGDPSAQSVDRCGVCGGDGRSCLIFEDGFESGDASAWSV